jgi:C4-dicarboxylate-specific signal transduction histidine kinase
MSVSKPVAVISRTEVLGSHDHEVSRRQDREVAHSAGDHLDAALAHLNRLSMMGELAASLAHEIITQPIATARNNAIAAMRFLDRTPPDLAEVRKRSSVLWRMQIVPETSSAESVPPRKDRYYLNDQAINEVIP